MKWRVRKLMEMPVGDVIDLQAIIQRLNDDQTMTMPDMLRTVSIAFGVKVDVAKSLNLTQLGQWMQEIATAWGKKEP